MRKSIPCRCNSSTLVTETQREPFAEETYWFSVLCFVVRKAPAANLHIPVTSKEFQQQGFLKVCSKNIPTFSTGCTPLLDHCLVNCPCNLANKLPVNSIFKFYTHPHKMFISFAADDSFIFENIFLLQSG